MFLKIYSLIPSGSGSKIEKYKMFLLQQYHSGEVLSKKYCNQYVT